MRKSKEEQKTEQQRQLSSGMKRLITGYRVLLESELEQEGITVAQLRMLRALSERVDTSAAELSRVCYITPQSMQAAITRAEREGWITRAASPANRRVLTATITRKGRSVLRRGIAVWERIETTIWAEAELAELHAINQTMNRALARMQHSLDEQHSAAATKRKTA